MMTRSVNPPKCGFAGLRWHTSENPLPHFLRWLVLHGRDSYHVDIRKRFIREFDLPEVSFAER
ncbi:hypothetical protein C8N44_11280 [Allosediminivita pacifica]|uniref:Uncharacterized protein n=1 Tax=Allosediminivita pacifica TaxID=1267769 RepID=A0A2T6AUP4_9RHOB|nr:hypothetical protein C8N44_11280 [Allosediminivita pacifica]